MYRAKVAGQWLDWVSNGTSQVMQEIKTQFSLSGNLDANATDAGYFSLGPITQLEIRVYERDTSGNQSLTYKRIKTPYVNQESENIPKGSEIASAVMAMQYFGAFIDVNSFYDCFMSNEYYNSAATINPNPNKVFLGDPKNINSIINGCTNVYLADKMQVCLNNASTEYANNNDKNFSVNILDNYSLSSLCSNYIDNNEPVIIWATVGMTDNCSSLTWIAKDDPNNNNSNNITVNYIYEHQCFLLVGYNDDYYFFKDPQRFGNCGDEDNGTDRYVKYSKSIVETAYNIMGKKAVVITNNNTSGVGTTNYAGYGVSQGKPGNNYFDIEQEPKEIPNGGSLESELFEDPIDLSTGSHVISHNLMTINGAQSISFNINYSSNLYIDGPLGYGWSHEFDKHIVETGNTINLFSGPAYYSVYTCSSGNVYTSNTPTHQYNTLIKGTTTYELKNRDGSKEIYDSNGKLTSIVSKGGLTVSITYPTNNQIRVTENVSGRYFTIETNTDGKIISVIDNDNRVATLSYTDDYLTGITDVNGKTISYLYNDNGQIYRGMDGNGTIFFTDYYDSYGRISSQKDAIADHEMSEISYEDIYSGNTFLYRLVTATDRNQKTSTYKYNQNKQLTEYTDANGVTTTYEYNSNGDLTKETNGLGYYASRVFDASGNVIETYDALNNMTEYTYDNNHNLIQIEYPNGSTITKTYNSDNLVTSVTDLRGVTTYYEYNTSKLLSRVTCINRVTEYDYTLGQVTTITDPLGRETTNVYNSRGFLTSTTDAKNNTTQYTYDNIGNVTSITDATNHTATNVYDCNGCITSSTDFAGNTTTYTYDGNLNMISMTLPINATIYYEYDGEDRLTSTLYPDGKSTLNTYDNGGRIISSKDKENGVTSYVYDNANQVIKVTNPLGGETTYQYDGNGYKTSSIQKVEDLDIDFYYDEYDVEYTFNETEYEYNSLGYLTKETNPAGGETTYTYNSAGDLLTITDPIGNTTTNTYDSYGNLVGKTDPRGYVTSYSYDLVGNLLSVTNALNQTTSYTYDNNNNLLSQTDPCGHTITYTYDALNRATAVTDAKGYTTYKTYDALGNVVQITDRQNHVDYAATYDALGRTVQTTDQAGSISTYTYDYSGNLTSLTNPLNQTSYYAYDGMGRMTSSIDFAGKTSTAVYDIAGNVTEITGPTGAKQKYVYDSQSRTIRNFINTYNDYWETCDHYEDLRYNELGEVVMRYKGNVYSSSTYDIAGRITGYRDGESTNTKTYDANGNIISEHNYSGTVTRVYDALNRVVSYSDVNGQTIEYEYDACGNLYRMKYPTGEYAVYSYDANHNLISSGIQGSNLVTTFHYDYKNRVTRIDNIDGSTVYKTYNAAGNLVNTADFDSDSHLIVVYFYQYDALGRLTSEYESSSNIRYLMQYDSMGRLTNRTGYSGFTDTVVEEESYIYDDAGNITSATSFDGITHTFTYGTSNELLRYDNSYIGNDISGRTEKCVSMQSGNGGVYYDNLDRIRSINGSYNGYWYDADGNRIDMYYYSTNMMYSWDSSDGRNRLVWTKDHLLNATIYGYGPEGLLWSLCNGDYKIYHYDYRGSVVAITDIDGDVINTFKYDAYGKTVAKTGTGKSIFGYNGEYGVLTDPTGLLYMRTRYYSPDLKRFMTPDIIKGSIADSSSLNLYTFVNGDPINYVDPFGMSAERARNNERVINDLHWLYNCSYDYYDYVTYEPDRVKLANEASMKYLIVQTYYMGDTDKRLAWETLLGYPDNEYLLYMNDHTEFLSLRNAKFYELETGETIDLIHMIATINAYYYDRPEFGTIKDSLNLYVGWAGDLITLAGDVQIALASDPNSDVRSLTKNMMGTEKTRFPYSDLVADVDAYYVAELLNNMQLGDAFKKYYESDNSDRFNRFIEREFNGNYEMAKYISYGYLKFSVPTHLFRKAFGSTYDYSLSSEFAAGFADYLWELSGR